MSLKQKIFSLVCISFPVISQAQSVGLDEQINDAFMPFANWWEGFILSTVSIGGYQVPIVLILLLLGALFFTIYFGFVNIKHFPTAIQVVRGKYCLLYTSSGYR